MIGPNDYSTNFYASPAAKPTLIEQKAALDAAADTQNAVDFERMLSGPAPAPVAAAETPAGADEGFTVMGFFKGVLDIINPLQHIPVIGAIYRHMTGDEINSAAKLAGDTLYGGPIGAALSVADIAYSKITGHDAGETMIAAVMPDKTEAPIQVAQNLNGISPAAGPAASGDITWNDEPQQVSRSSLTPPLPRLGSNVMIEPVTYAPTPAPAHLAKGNATPTYQSPTASKVDSTIVLQPQEAPVAGSRTDLAPELIAARMMEGLDKYHAMKTGQLGTMVSGVY